ncbi:RDD family protein [[Mycobacterium] holstebronense]|uniref:RDD family protein n=1 Tax=[Mycobacterium] holstebronense TaxID=3064288 RepID=A0ABN9NCE0_9MYCO|nr:RDD family protein [Mycolicibacter sp. MU0102]CAJ1502384.1 RDD family protein [Mycolicibacter sp. MU0102]
MSRTFSSWLSGPEPTDTGEYPGQRFGLPRSGAGSMAGFGRRLLALALDYFVAVGLTALAVPLGWISSEAFQYSPDVRFLILVVWLVLDAAALRLFGFTPGQYACGLRVIPVDSADTGVGIVRAAVRGLLIALVVPALFADADGRGLQDRATATAVVRSR